MSDSASSKQIKYRNSTALRLAPPSTCESSGILLSPFTMINCSMSSMARLTLLKFSRFCSTIRTILARADEARF